MAYEMEYTDQYSETYPESYWRVEPVNLTKTTASAVFYGYKDAASAGGRIIGTKEYPNIFGANFLTYFSASALAPEDVTPQSKAYEYALFCKDTGSLDNMVSFFENAESV